MASAQAQQTAQPRRLALVVDNSEYRHVAALQNPRNDASDVAAKPRQLKFIVTLLVDAERRVFEERLSEFTRTVTPGDTALVFYAGHGITVNGESFLLLVDVPNYVVLPDGTLRSQPVDEMIKLASIREPVAAEWLGCKSQRLRIGRLGRTKHQRYDQLAETRAWPRRQV